PSRQSSHQVWTFRRACVIVLLRLPYRPSGARLHRARFGQKALEPLRLWEEPMEFGLMQEFQPVPNSNEADSFAKSLEQIDAAERLGLYVIWVADLHFLPQLSVMSSSLLAAAAIAGRTSRIKIGTAVQILPLHPPLRVAEDIATLDHLSA